ncbi:MAG: DMSO reductase [Desulfobacteraceae bacterium]
MSNYNLIGKWFPPPRKQAAYDWMIRETQQKEWIEQQGIFLWLAFFVSEIGAGLYFVAMLHNYIPGMAAGWICTLVLGGVIHMAYLGNPKRFWRIFLKPHRSELSRGVWVIGLFALFGLLQLLVFGPESGFLKTVTGIVCILLVMHGFATMNVMKALPAWSSTILIPLSIVSGLWVGSQIFQFMLAAGGGNAAGFEKWAAALFAAYIVMLLLYIWSTSHLSETARVSIRTMIKGEYAGTFLVCVIGAGIFLPLVFTLIMAGGSINGWWIFLRLVFVLFGDLMMRYFIMKSAFYTPLI